MKQKDNAVAYTHLSLFQDLGIFGFSIFLFCGVCGVCGCVVVVLCWFDVGYLEKFWDIWEIGKVSNCGIDLE